MLQGRKPLNIPQTSLQLRCGRRLLAQISFDPISAVDEGALCPRPFHGTLQTPDARALQECRERESVGYHVAGRCGLLAKRITRGCPHLHQGYGRRTGERDGSECVRNATGADACGVTSAGGSGMP